MHHSAPDKMKPAANLILLVLVAPVIGLAVTLALTTARLFQNWQATRAPKTIATPQHAAYLAKWKAENGY